MGSFLKWNIVETGRSLPVNIISLPLPFPCLTKKSFSFLSIVLVILNVDAKPEPPWEAMLVVIASRESAANMAGSIFGAIAKRFVRTRIQRYGYLELVFRFAHVFVDADQMLGVDHMA